MYDHEIEDFLDYEGMYKQLSAKKYRVREQLTAVLTSSAILSSVIPL